MNRRGLLAFLALLPLTSGRALAAESPNEIWHREMQDWYGRLIGVSGAYEAYLAAVASSLRSDWRGRAGEAQADAQAHYARFARVVDLAAALAAAPPPPAVTVVPSYEISFAKAMVSALSTARELVLAAVRRPEASQSALLALIAKAAEGDAQTASVLERRSLEPMLRGLRVHDSITEVLNAPHKVGALDGNRQMNVEQLYVGTCVLALQAIADAADGRPVERAALAKEIRRRARALQRPGELGAAQFGPMWATGAAAFVRLASLIEAPASSPHDWREPAWAASLAVLSGSA